jgi:hypothetical protein
MGSSAKLSKLACWLILLWLPLTSYSKEFMLHQRLKLSPEIVLTETFNDNIYRSDRNEDSDFITAIYPGFNLAFALFPGCYLDLIYLGAFESYQEADNVREDHHYGGLGMSFGSGQKSRIAFGIWGEDTANQPFSEDEESRDFRIGAVYTDVDLNITAKNQMFGNCQYSQRRYKDDINEIDDYDRQFVALGTVYSPFEQFPLLMEYRHEIQDNKEAIPDAIDFSYDAAYSGLKWGEERRLSGSLRLGYLWSQYNDKDIYNGWSTHTNLSYAVSPFTTAVLKANRDVRVSNISERESLDYYIYEGLGLSVDWRRLHYLQLKLTGRYEQRNFKTAEGSHDDRKDRIYTAGLTGQWDFKRWASVVLGYRFRENQSNDENYDYREDRMSVELILFSEGNLRNKRKPRSSYDINRY